MGLAGRFRAAFRRQARRANRPVVLRLVHYGGCSVRPLQRPFSIAAERTRKAVETAYRSIVPRLTSRKTAGLLALRASLVNEALTLLSTQYSQSSVLRTRNSFDLMA